MAIDPRLHPDFPPPVKEWIAVHRFQPNPLQLYMLLQQYSYHPERRYTYPSRRQTARLQEAFGLSPPAHSYYRISIPENVALVKDWVRRSKIIPIRPLTDTRIFEHLYRLDPHHPLLPELEEINSKVNMFQHLRERFFPSDPPCR